MAQSSTNLDLYHVLGLRPDADTDAVRRAYRSLARMLHPDVNPAPDAADRFSQVSHAYAVLSDPARRRQYDEQRYRPQPASAATVGNTFGGARVSRGVLRGRDVEAQVHVSLRDAVKGVEAKVDVPRREVCAICVGTGAGPGGTSERCPRCLGTGGTRSGGEECGRCLGSGVVGDPACPNCHGAGRRQGQTQIVVSLPAGVEDGQRLVLKGDGDVGPRNGPRGDLIVRVVVDPDPVLRRHGMDILMDVTISPEEAAHGTNVEVPTLKGTKRLRIPAGTRDKAILRMGGIGVRLSRLWHHGDQFVTVHIAPDGERSE